MSVPNDERGGQRAPRRQGFIVEAVTGAGLVVDGGPRAGRPTVLEDDPRHGAVDDRALAMLNAVIGLPWHAPAIEVLLGPLRLRACTPLVVAADDGGPLVVDGVAVPPWSAVVVDEGAVVTVGAAAGLGRTLAVRTVEGARIASPPGTTLARDTVVGITDVDDMHAPGEVVALPPIANEIASLTPGTGDDGALHLRVVPGPERERFAADVWDALLATSWTVAPTSSRQGVRLTTTMTTTTMTTTTALRPPTSELVTTGVWTGAVQVPPSGMPIVLGVDSRTTGGYARLAHVIAVDRFVLAHARPGRALRFVAVDVREARALHRAFATRFRPTTSLTPTARPTR